MQHFSLNVLRDTDDFACLTFFDLPLFTSIDNLTGEFSVVCTDGKKMFVCFEQEIVCVKQRMISRLFNIAIQ
jgi:hypothetical protein